MADAKRILVLHGPNLNMLGGREPEIYGSMTLAQINRMIEDKAAGLGLSVDTFQSNSEGELITRIQEAVGKYHGVIINPAGYTHTSIGMRDALLLLDAPVVEIHLSNIYRREPFRHHSMTAGAATAQLAGFGPQGYVMALEALAEMIKK